LLTLAKHDVQAGLFLHEAKVDHIHEIPVPLESWLPGFSLKTRPGRLAMGWRVAR
jgi:hypothetical protein